MRIAAGRMFGDSAEGAVQSQFAQNRKDVASDVKTAFAKSK